MGKSTADFYGPLRIKGLPIGTLTKLGEVNVHSSVTLLLTGIKRRKPSVYGGSGAKALAKNAKFRL
jgi:hypothetical protein